MDKYDYKGAIHVHSTYSDGKGSVEEIMQAANDVGLDFVILTDHETLKPRDDGHEKWHGNSMLIVGAEITPPDNHYITFGEDYVGDISELRKLPSQGYIDALRERNWLGFIAHPYFVGAKKFGVGTYKWLDWSVDNFTGIGIWNLLDDWTSQLNRDKLTDDLYHNFPKWLSGPHTDTVKRFDGYSLKRKVVMIGEVDNHNSTVKYEGKEFKVFPYEVAFRSITNHVLLDEPLAKDFNTAKKQVLDAIRAGHLYVSFDFYHDPSEFSFEIESRETGGMGDEIEYSENCEVIASLPQEAHVSLIKNGLVVDEKDGYELMAKIDSPGVYRIKADKEGLVWIMSNPIYVK